MINVQRNKQKYAMLIPLATLQESECATVPVEVLRRSNRGVYGDVYGTRMWLPKLYVGHHEYEPRQLYFMNVPVWLLRKRGLCVDDYQSVVIKERDMPKEALFVGHAVCNTNSGMLVCGDFFEGVDAFEKHVVYVNALTHQQYSRGSGWRVYQSIDEAVKAGTWLKLRNKNTGEQITGYFVRQTTRYIHIRSQSSYAHEYGWEPVVSKEVRAERAKARCSPDMDELIGELRQKEQILEKIRKVMCENEEDV